MTKKAFEVELWPIEKIKPYKNNPRKNDGAVDAVAASLKEFGFRQPVVVDGKGVIVAGHTRWKAAKKIGLAKIPVHVATDLTAKQVRAYRLADNKTGELSEWDYEFLPIEISDLVGDYDMTDFGFDESELAELLGTGKTQGLTDPDAIPDPPEDPVTKPGDLWLLGEHRLLCGDSTKAEDVERVMEGKKADMIFTDPPYGVSYVGKTKDALTIESDDISPEQLAEKNKKWFDCADSILREGAYVMATVPARPLHLIFAQDWLDRGWLRQIMVWNKNVMVMGHSEYHYKHEPILFGWKPGDRLKNTDRTKTTVWDFDRPTASREHPTIKPIAMWEYGIANHTKKGDILYELFLGSGTTLIACEKTGRKCYGMEIDPHYCDVIIARYEAFTGKKAVLQTDKKKGKRND